MAAILISGVYVAQKTWAQAGSVDTNFNPDPVISATAGAVILQPDGRILVGGSFRKAVDGSGENFVARLNQDGSWDAGFNPGAGPDSFVEAIALRPDGSVLIGGSFSQVSGFQCNEVARLNANGAVDTNFVSGLTSYGGVTAFALQADGKVIVINGTGETFVDRLLTNGIVDPGFHRFSSFQLLTNADGSVSTANLQFNSVQVLSDGKILLAGSFPAILGSARGGLVRLNADGSLDTSFIAPIPAADGFVLTGDGGIIVSVSLTNAANMHQLVRLHATDGSLDSSFQSTATLDSNVRGVKLQADGKVLVHGDFRQVGGLRRVGIARFNTDGSLDTGLDAGFDLNTEVLTLNVQSDQKILVGGNLNWPGSSSTRYLRRLNNDSPGSPGRIEFGQASFRVMEDAGNLVVPVYRNGGTNGPITVQYATQNGSAVPGRQYTPESGTLSFASGQLTNSFVIPIFDDLIVQTNEVFQQFGLRLSNPTSGAVLGSQSSAQVTIGDFDIALQFNTPTYSELEPDLAAAISVVRLGYAQRPVSVNYATADGTARAGVDYSPQAGTLVFAPGEFVKSFTVPLLSDSFVNPVETILLTLRNPAGGAILGSLSNATLRIVEQNPGAPDSTFIPATNVIGGDLLLVQGDGKIILAGNVDHAQGGYLTSFFRLNADGSFDPTFSWDNGLGGYFYCSALQPDGKVLVGGAALSVNGSSRGSVLRLNADGTVDNGFNADGSVGLGSSVFSLALQADGKIVAAGGNFNLSGPSTNILRLNADGSVDGSFMAQPSDLISKILLQPDGKILVCGRFSQIGTNAYPGLARLNADGSVDPSFVPAVGISSFAPVLPTMVLQTDGKVIVDGWLAITPQTSSLMMVRLNQDGNRDSSLANSYVTETHALTLQAQGKIVFGTSTGVIRRLNADGSLDTTFDAGSGADNGYVKSLAMQADGSIIVAGGFVTVDGIPRPGVARLKNDTASAAGKLEFTLASQSIPEKAGTNLVLKVRRTGGTNGVVLANYGVSGGSAIPGTDFAPVSGTMTFQDGEAGEKEILVSIFDDQEADGGETVELWLGTPLGGATWGLNAVETVTILDNNVELQIVQDYFGVTISWPLLSAGFVLESTTNLVQPNWQPASEVPATNNNHLQISVSADQGQRFFRLHKRY